MFVFWSKNAIVFKLNVHFVVFSESKFKCTDPQRGALTPPSAPDHSGGRTTSNDRQLVFGVTPPNTAFSLPLSLFLGYRAADLHSSAHGKAEELQRSALRWWNALRDFTRKPTIRWFYGTYTGTALLSDYKKMLFEEHLTFKQLLSV